MNVTIFIIDKEEEDRGRRISTRRRSSEEKCKNNRLKKTWEKRTIWKSVEWETTTETYKLENE